MVLLLSSLLLFAQTPAVQRSGLRGTVSDAAGNDYKIDVEVTSSIITDDKGRTCIRYIIRNLGVPLSLNKKDKDLLILVWSAPGIKDPFKDYRTVVDKKPVLVDIPVKSTKLITGQLYIKKGDEETLCQITTPTYQEGD